MTASNAIIAYENLLEEGTVVASSENASYPVSNVFNGVSSDFFKPAAGGTVTIDLTLTGPASADYFAFYNQNLWTLGGSIKLQRWNGSAYVDVVAVFAPVDNAPRLVMFSAVTSDKWRVSITCASVFSIACISFGLSLPLERGMYLEWTPPQLARATELVTSRSDGGAFLGRSIVALGVSTTIELNKASDAWVRAKWMPFVRHAERKPFFFCHNVAAYPNECAFCWVEEAVPPPRHSNHGFMSASVPIKGLVE